MALLLLFNLGSLYLDEGNKTFFDGSIMGAGGNNQLSVQLWSALRIAILKQSSPCRISRNGLSNWRRSRPRRKSHQALIVLQISEHAQIMEAQCPLPRLAVWRTMPMYHLSQLHPHMSDHPLIIHTQLLLLLMDKLEMEPMEAEVHQLSGIPMATQLKKCPLMLEGHRIYLHPFNIHPLHQHLLHLHLHHIHPRPWPTQHTVATAMAWHQHTSRVTIGKQVVCT